jgi:peptidoglycan pentaglycine glycine transferase (the first glycine)
MRQIQRAENRQEWDEMVHTNGGHPLQLWGWGEVKAAHGWQADRVVVKDNEVLVGGAQLLIRRLPKPFNALVYIPRGPLEAEGKGEILRDELAAYVHRTYKAVTLTAEPDITGSVSWKGWRQSANRILLKRTAVMDLTQTDDELMAQMSKKTRQYIRKSASEGIEVTTAQNETDIGQCMAIYKQTAGRAGFALHDDAYYQDIFKELGADSPVYMAKYSGQVIAFLWPIVTPEVAFELYGGMNDEGQRLRANYHLKWSVIQAMKEQGVRRYDVNGLLNDGVTAFKKGFIPEETQMAGTFDKPLSPLYPIWSILLPWVKKILQRIRR